MSEFVLLREERPPHDPPRLAWVLCAILAGLLVLPNGGWHHSIVRWVKEQADRLDDHPDVSAPPPQEVPGAPRLVVRVNRNDRCLVHVMVNGIGPLAFILDTGAPNTVLTRAQGRRIGINLARLKPDHSSGGWGGGTTDGVFTRVDLQLASFRLNGFEVAVENETQFQVGLLGISFIRTLKRFDVAGGYCRFWW
jgi:aspartyl protease family protein